MDRSAASKTKIRTRLNLQHTKRVEAELKVLLIKCESEQNTQCDIYRHLWVCHESLDKSTLTMYVISNATMMKPL